MIAENISFANRVIQDSTDEKNSQKSETGEKTPLQKASSMFICTDQKYECHVGISRMWVHKSHRRKGIATKLLDAIR